jgi:hypothetical protein
VISSTDVSQLKLCIRVYFSSTRCILYISGTQSLLASKLEAAGSEALRAVTMKSTGTQVSRNMLTFYGNILLPVLQTYTNTHEFLSILQATMVDTENTEGRIYGESS